MTGTAGRRRRTRVAVTAVAAAALAGLVLIAILPSWGRGGETGSSAGEVTPTRIGYVPYWDQERGFEVVRQQPELFDEVSPVWYSLESNGRIRLADPANTTVDRDAVRSLQEQGIRVIPTVTNLRDGDWETGPVRRMLRDPAAVRTHIRELVALATGEGYDGIDIDYEHLRAADRDAFSDFLARLGDALRAEGKLLTAAVHPKTSEAGDDERNAAQDYRAIGAAVDQVRVMTYDYSWEDSPPGPVAPATWVEDVVAWTVARIPAHKVILGVVLLGYDWGDGPGETVDYEQARETAQANGARVRRGEDGSPWFTYERSGTRHEVWYEDADSVAEKLALVPRYGLGGAFFWRLGGEDPQVWHRSG